MYRDGIYVYKKDGFREELAAGDMRGKLVRKKGGNIRNGDRSNG